MKKKLKLTKSHIICFILGALIFGLVGVSAATYFPSNNVTYDNKASGLNSNNVQSAIDELYNSIHNSITGGESILGNVPIVTSGDGLYKDEYEEGKYTYKGTNPNNYITFNGENAGWRIVSIKVDGTIKIIRAASIENRAWDTSNSNNWTRPATLNTYLNDTYYNSLNENSKKQIIANIYSIGGVTWNNNDINKQISDENNIIWGGRIALITVSEYLRANSNKQQCENMNLNYDNNSTCNTTNWMFNNDFWWTLSMRSSTDNIAFYVSNSGRFDYSGNTAKNTSIAVRPVVTLSSNVKITSGNGSQSNPYTLSL